MHPESLSGTRKAGITLLASALILALTACDDNSHTGDPVAPLPR